MTEVSTRPIDRRKTIPAIKAVREECHCSLRAAHDAVRQALLSDEPTIELAAELARGFNLNCPAIWKLEDMRCGQDIVGVFIASQAQIKKLQGIPLYFGDIAGKHSSVTLEITPDNCRKVTDNAESVRVVKELGLCHGPDPVAVYKDLVACGEIEEAA